MITDEQLSDLYFEVLGVRLAEFDAAPAHALMRAIEQMARQDEREACSTSLGRLMHGTSGVIRFVISNCADHIRNRKDT